MRIIIITIGVALLVAGGWYAASLSTSSAGADPSSRVAETATHLTGTPRESVTEASEHAAQVEGDYFVAERGCANIGDVGATEVSRCYDHAYQAYMGAIDTLVVSPMHALGPKISGVCAQRFAAWIGPRGPIERFTRRVEDIHAGAQSHDGNAALNDPILVHAVYAQREQGLDLAAYCA